MYKNEKFYNLMTYSLKNGAIFQWLICTIFYLVDLEVLEEN